MKGELRAGLIVVSLERGRNVKRASALTLVTGLTLARVPLVLIFLVLALVNDHSPSPGLSWAALASLVAASLTDLFDGHLARKWQVVSRFGAMADPLMDKVFYLVVFPTLLFLLGRRGEAEGAHTVVMLIFTILYLLRDQWVTFLRSIASAYQADVSANWMGKLRTALSFPIGCLIYFYLAMHPVWLQRTVVYGFEGLGILISLASIAVYTREYLPYLRRAMDP